MGIGEWWCDLTVIIRVDLDVSEYLCLVGARTNTQLIIAPDLHELWASSLSNPINRSLIRCIQLHLRVITFRTLIQQRQWSLLVSHNGNVWCVHSAAAIVDKLTSGLESRNDNYWLIWLRIAPQWMALRLAVWPLRWISPSSSALNDDNENMLTSNSEHSHGSIWQETYLNIKFESRLWHQISHAEISVAVMRYDCRKISRGDCGIWKDFAGRLKSEMWLFLWRNNRQQKFRKNAQQEWLNPWGRLGVDWFGKCSRGRERIISFNRVSRTRWIRIWVVPLFGNRLAARESILMNMSSKYKIFKQLPAVFPKSLPWRKATKNIVIWSVRSRLYNHQIECEDGIALQISSQNRYSIDDPCAIGLFLFRSMEVSRSAWIQQR